MTPRRFTEEIDTYTVLLLNLAEYRAPERTLPAEFEFLDAAKRDTIRGQEKQLLQQLFDDWDIPYCGKLRGWRADSPLYVVRDTQLVGGAFICDGNEFDDDPTRGQLHYAFMNPQFQGLGVYSVIFREVVTRARSWGLTEIYLNSDRYMLPEVYLRWGAKPWRVIEKQSRIPHNRLGRLLRQVRWCARRIRQMWLESCE